MLTAYPVNVASLGIAVPATGWRHADLRLHLAGTSRQPELCRTQAWDWKAALRALQRFILAYLGDPEAIVVLDETAELKKGTRTVGVARHHAGITGQVENCQSAP